MNPAWKYIIPLISLALITAVLTIVGWFNRKIPGGKGYAVMMLVMTLWMVFYGTGMLMGSESSFLVIANLEYVMMVALPLCWLLFSLQYAEADGWSSPGILAVIMALPVLLVIIAISGIAPNLYFNHHNFFGLEPEYRSPYDRVTWSYIHIGYSLIYFIAGTVLVIRRINRNPNVSARQSIIITLGMLVPWIGNITFIFRVSPIQNLDLAPFAFTLSGVLLAWGLF